MALRHILVHLDESERCGARLTLAIKLAQRFEALLTGFFAENDPRVMTVALLDAERVLGPAAERAEGWFRERAGVAGIRADWSAALTVGDAALIEEAVAAVQVSDLAIFGQHDPHRPDIRTPAELAEQVVLHGGRPVLIVPYAGDVGHVGRRIMIAWNAGREAARALNDALPLLHGAEHVALVAINVEHTGRRQDDARFLHIRRHLAAHGVRADIDRMIVQDIGVMDMLLARLADEAIDLLVMGAHGHYGFPYMNRGGGTRHILRHMTVPVLMSH